MEFRSRCNNAIHLLNHFKKLGVRESKILDGLTVNKKHIANPHNWITVKDWYKMMDNCHAAAPFTTLEDWYKIGFYLKDSETSKIFEMITKLVGIRAMYKLVPKYSNNFNTYMRIDLNTIGSDYADYTENPENYLQTNRRKIMQQLNIKFRRHISSDEISIDNIAKAFAKILIEILSNPTTKTIDFQK